MIAPTNTKSYCSFAETSSGYCTPERITILVTTLLIASAFITYFAGGGNFPTLVLATCSCIAFAISLLFRYQKPEVQAKEEPIAVPQPASASPQKEPSPFAEVVSTLESRNVTSEYLLSLPPTVFQESDSHGRTLADIAIENGVAPALVKYIIDAQGNYTTPQAIAALNKSPVKGDQNYRMQILVSLYSRT